ncbi:SDR family NAD(P)-dependent oxidoreductase [Nostoc sp. FACHB-888]|uniref:SDR family NAD(P)-dependent oxidoreductase n=1 Tax=Nostoc sp. FACHB-888 TaxID=2692842 RepID=UPI0016823569|nr:SDR family NAD(P)-dependent oxidoreductase [Nostoc sp. FACHB-888]MBD2245836.1 SDR family NAD(P)-dependent oxidoreductase [Nostoc sp. FACHB-888]
MTNKKVVLVTGASSGFGQLTAQKLAQEGYLVFGTSRKEHPASVNVEMLMLDVTSESSVQSCIKQLLTRTNRIDLLINNAGQIHASMLEETSLEQAKEIFETNFWGVVRLTNAVLPVMRQQRSGHIINMSSVAGLIGAPGQGFYSASKFALEGYSEALSVELDPFNIKVSLIEPGYFKTNFNHAMLSPTLNYADYDNVRDVIRLSVNQAIAQGDDREKVAQTIVFAARSRFPRLRYRVGNEAQWLPRLKAILPDKLFRFGARKRLNLP